MPLPTCSPGGSDRSTFHWAFRSTDPGGSWHAYLWGQIHGFMAHPSRRTKPCVEVLTDGKLRCELPNCPHGRQWIGYVPLVRESDGRPCMVIIHEHAASLLDGVGWRSRVLVMREAGQHDGVSVCRAMVQREWDTRLVALRRPADLTQTLLAVWKMPELCAWYAAREREASAQPSDTLVSPPTVGPMLAAAEVRADITAQVLRARGGSVDQVGELLAHVNGKAARKPK